MDGGPFVDPHGETGVERDAGETRVDGGGRDGIEQQRREGGRGRNNRVSERLRYRVSPAVASGLRKRLSSGRQDHGMRKVLARRRVERKAGLCARDGMDPSARGELNAGGQRAAQQRVQDVACSMAVRKEFATRFFVERDAEIAKEAGGGRRRKGAQHAADDRALAPGEIGLGHHCVRDVAPAAAADEDLRARFRGAIDQPDTKCRAGAPRENRKSTRLNSSHSQISYAVFCLKKKKKNTYHLIPYKKTKNKSQKKIIK